MCTLSSCCVSDCVTLVPIVTFWHWQNAASQMFRVQDTGNVTGWPPLHRSQCRQYLPRLSVQCTGPPPPLWGYRVTEWVVSGAILTTRGDIRDQLTPVCPVYTITHLDPGLVTLNRLQWSKDHQPQNVTRLWSLILSQLTGWMSDSRRGLSLAWKLQTTASCFTTPETFPCSGNILLPLVPGQEDFAVKRFSLKEKINRGGGKENYMILLIYEGVTKSFSNLSDWLRHSFQVKSSWSLIDKTKQWNKNSSNIFTQHLVM